MIEEGWMWLVQLDSGLGGMRFFLVVLFRSGSRKGGRKEGRTKKGNNDNNARLYLFWQVKFRQNGIDAQRAPGREVGRTNNKSQWVDTQKVNRVSTTVNFLRREIKKKRIWVLMASDPAAVYTFPTAPSSHNDSNKYKKVDRQAWNISVSASSCFLPDQ